MFVVSDSHGGLTVATANTSRGERQRCWVHLMRNLLVHGTGESPC